MFAADVNTLVTPASDESQVGDYIPHYVTIIQLINPIVVASDNPGIFASIGTAFAEEGINLTRANVQQGAHKRAYFDVSIEIHDVEHLNQTLEKIRQVEGVIYLERLKDFNKSSPVKSRLEGMGRPLELKGEKKLTVN